VTILDMATLSERVQEALIEANENGFNIASVAEACGVTVQAVYQWRDGATKVIEGDKLVELAEVSGYTARWIATEKGPKKLTKEMRQAQKLMADMTQERQQMAVKIIAPLAERQSGSPASNGD
jgi:transcriptional regulator with XRE-family HTH domain